MPTLRTKPHTAFNTTRNPKTIDRDILAGEALEILNSSKITTLIVTDANKPVGIVHLHDFLRAGVA